MAEVRQKKKALPPHHTQSRQYSKLGCSTCKSRRVKCDEARPFCNRCQKGGWPCRYKEPARPSGEIPLRLLPKSSSKSVLPSNDLKAAAENVFTRTCLTSVLLNPARSLGTMRGDQVDHVYFHYFRERTAHQLGGIFKTDLWESLTLQAAELDESIWHAVVAIGAISKAYDVVSNTTSKLVTATQGMHHNYGLQHYGKALSKMREQSSRATQDVTTILLGCLLTVCFETFQGNRQNALKQFVSGSKLLNIACPQDEQTYSNLTCDFGIPASLLRAFEQLQSQNWMLTFTDRRNPPTQASIIEAASLAEEKDKSTSFTNVKEAQQCYASVLKQIYQFLAFLSQAAPIDIQSQDSDALQNLGFIDKFPLPPHELPAWIVTEQNRLLDTLADWNVSIQPLLSKDCPVNDGGAQDFFSIRILAINALVIASTLSATFAQTELVWDNYYVQWKAAIEHCTRILLNKRFSQDSITIDSGIVAPIFSIIMKCRHPALRRQAIALMARFPRREGFWDSVLCAVVGKWLMDIEEEGIVDGYVPEVARARGLKVEEDLYHRKAHVECLQQKASHPGEWQIRSATLTW